MPGLPCRVPTTTISGTVTASISGTLLAEIISPLSSYGEVNVSELSVVGQGDFVYNVNTEVFWNQAYSGGSITTGSGFATVQCGTSTTGSSELSLRRGLKYRPGLGAITRIAAIFGTPISGNLQQVGMGNAECGYYFGYYGTNFGIHYISTSQREIRKLTITVGAGTQNVTVTLNGVAVTVPITGGSNINQTSYQIGKYDYSNVGSGWLTDVIDGSVYFMSGRADNYSGTYSLAGATVVGAFTTVQTGTTGVSTFIPQDNFNLDKLDGTGTSGFNIAPLSGNLYQIQAQSSGFANAILSVGDSVAGKMLPAHIIRNLNAGTTLAVKNPQVAAQIRNINIGNTTPVNLKGASMSSYMEGLVARLDPTFTTGSVITNINSATNVPLMAIKMNRTYNGETCRGEFDILRLSAGNESTSKTLHVSLYKNVTINGVVNFQYVNETNSMVSVAQLDPSAQTINAGTQTPFYSFTVGPTSARTMEVPVAQLVVRTGEIIVVVIRTSGAVDGDFYIDWYEQ